MSQTITLHEAYRIARKNGFIKDQPVSYATMAGIVASAYQQGYKKTKSEANKKPQS